MSRFPPNWQASMAESVWAAAFTFHLRHSGPGVDGTLGTRILREAVERAEWTVGQFLEAADHDWFSGVSVEDAAVDDENGKPTRADGYLCPNCHATSSYTGGFVAECASCGYSEAR